MIVRPVDYHPLAPEGSFVPLGAAESINLIPSILILCSVWARAMATPNPEVDHHGHADDSNNMMFSSSQKNNSRYGGFEFSQTDPTEPVWPHEHLDHHSVVGQDWTPSNSDNDNPSISDNTNLLSTPDDGHLPADSLSQAEFSDTGIINSPTSRHRSPDKELLSHNLADAACKLDRGCQRKDRLNNTYLDFCTRYKLENLFSNQILMSIMHNSSDKCKKILDQFIQLDEKIQEFYTLFKTLLTRYNCHNGYSVKWTCEDCENAYKDWLCATSLPYYMNGELIKPCISFCERVEQRCPYLHPITKEQYGGQPVFICRDPNIPFVPEITPDIPYSEPNKCYDLCHLSQNRTELVIDSLSKYDPDDCPDKNLIAFHARNNNDDPQCRMQLNETTSFIFDPTKRSSNMTNKHPSGVDIHMKKLNELIEVLRVYQSQPETHKFGHNLEHTK